MLHIILCDSKQVKEDRELSERITLHNYRECILMKQKTKPYKFSYIVAC